MKGALLLIALLAAVVLATNAIADRRSRQSCPCAWVALDVYAANAPDEGPSAEYRSGPYDTHARCLSAIGGDDLAGVVECRFDSIATIRELAAAHSR